MPYFQLIWYLFSSKTFDKADTLILRNGLATKAFSSCNLHYPATQTFVYPEQKHTVLKPESS